MNKRIFILSLAILLTAAPQLVLGADAGPAATRWSVRPLSEVSRHLAPALDREALAREDLDREEQGLPFRFAHPEVVFLSPDEAGTWETLSEGRSLWRLRVHSPDVISLNLGFTRFWLPVGARLLVYPASGQGGSIQVYDETDNGDHGELWTPVLLTDEVVVELEVDDSVRWQVDLELTSIGRGYRVFGEDLTDKSGACNIDVVCEEGNDWRDEIDTVGVYSLGGSTFCTGFMINNTEQDGTPYFMTAYHCDVRAVLAPSLVVYWNYQSPECGDQGGGSLDDNQTGAILRAEYSTSDMALLELDELPDPSFGVKYAGWNRGDTAPSSAVCIHHPSTDEKSISFEDDPLLVTSYNGHTSPGNGTHLKVIQWDLGTTERGSSGSPLFDPNHRVVGQLHGGAAACNGDQPNNLPDWYGFFHVSWDGGGADINRLSNWLDPQGTGDLTVDTIDPFGTSFTVAPEEGLESSGIQGGPFVPEQMVYTLTNSGQGTAMFTAAVADTWLSVEPEDGSIPVGGTATVTVALTAEVATLDVGTHQSTLQIVNAGSGSGTTDRPISVTVEPIIPDNNVTQITGVVPNPFGSPAVPETQIRFTLAEQVAVTGRIFDVRGGLVRVFSDPKTTSEGHYFSWDGYDHRGRRAPSGKYIFVLNTGDQELRTNIILVH